MLKFKLAFFQNPIMRVQYSSHIVDSRAMVLMNTFALSNHR
jgi:hypothetical protein